MTDASSTALAILLLLDQLEQLLRREGAGPDVVARVHRLEDDLRRLRGDLPAAPGGP